MADEGLQIKITAPKAKEVAKVLGDLNEKILTLSKNAANVNLDNEKTKDAVKTLEQMSKGMISYAKAVNETNKANREAELNQVRVKMGYAQLEAQLRRNINARERDTAAAEKANQPYNRLVAALNKTKMVLQNMYTDKEKSGLKQAISDYQKLSNEVKRVQDSMSVSSGSSYKNLTAQLVQYGEKLRNSITDGNRAEGALHKMGMAYKRLQDRIANINAEFDKYTRKQQKDISVYDSTSSKMRDLENTIKNLIISGSSNEQEIVRLANEYKKLNNEVNNANTRFKELTATEQKVQKQNTSMLGAYETINKQLQIRATRLKELIASGGASNSMLQAEANAYKSLQAKLNEVNAKFKELTVTEQKVEKTTLTMKVALASFIALQANTFIYGLVYGFKDLIASISQAGIQMDALRNTFMAATGGWQQGGQEMQWLIDMSNRLGLGFGSVSDSYAKFMTSFTRSGGTIEQSRQIFEDISTAMVNLHLPAERMQGVFVALEQMANKGTVQAEELKRQLGNALPAAFEIGAESMGILPSKLMDMMKAGQVFSKDFLPNFAKSVRENLGQGIDIATNQFNASLGRLNTAVSLFQMETGQLLNEALKPLVNLAVPVVSALANMAKFFNENAAASALLKGALIGLTVATIPALLSLVVQVKVALVSMFPALAAINVSLGGLPLIIGAVVTGLTSLGFYLNDCSQKAADVTPYIGLREQIVELTKSVTELDLSTTEGAKQLEQYKQEFPQLTQYLIENKKTLDQLTEADFKQIEALGQVDKQQQLVMETEKQLNSWQIRTAATFRVVWRNIAETVKSACSSMIDDWNRWQTARNQKRISELESSIKEEQKVVQKLSGGSKNVLFEKGSWNEKLYYSNVEAIKKQQEEIDKLKGINKEKEKSITINEALKSSGFAGEINQEILNMTKFNEKLDAIQKNATGTTRNLTVAKANYVGLQKEDAKSTKTTQAKTKATKDEWKSLNDNISKTEEAIRVGKLHGQNTTALEEKYKKLKAQQDAVNDSLKDLTGTQKSAYQQMQENLSALQTSGLEKLATGGDASGIAAQYKAQKEQLSTIDAKWEELTSSQDNSYEGLKKQEKAASSLYKTMLLNSSQYSQAQIDQQARTVKELKLKAKQVELEDKHQEAIQITQRTAKGFSDTVIDGIFNTLDSSESIWDSFKDAAISAFKTIAAAWTKEFVNKMIVDFQSGSLSAGGGILSQLKGGILGVLGSGSSGTTTPSTSLKIKSGGFFSNLFGGGSSSSTTATNPAQTQIDGLAQSASNLGSIFSDQTNPAIDNALNSLSFFGDTSDVASNAATSLISPVASSASSLVSMATSAPIAATSMGVMSAAMTALSPLCVTAAPALATMSASLDAIAVSAANAATAMAALAVATAAESAAQIPLIGWTLAPVAAALTGAAISAATILTGAGIAAGATVAGAGQALGGTISKLGTSTNVVAHAKGGVVSSPTTFPMSGGNIGLAGEAGTEVIAPAKRMSNGDLGVGAVQPNVTVNNYANAAVEVIKRPDNEMEIKITELNAMLSSSRTNRGFSNATQRMSNKGKQIG